MSGPILLPSSCLQPLGTAHRAGLLTQFPCQAEPYLSGYPPAPRYHLWVTWCWAAICPAPQHQVQPADQPPPFPGSYLFHLLLCVVASRVLDHLVRAGSWGQKHSEQRATPASAHRAGATVGDSIVLRWAHEGRNLPPQPQLLHGRGKRGVLSEAAIHQLRFGVHRAIMRLAHLGCPFLSWPSLSPARLGIQHSSLGKYTSICARPSGQCLPSRGRNEGRKE